MKRPLSSPTDETAAPCVHVTVMVELAVLAAVYVHTPRSAVVALVVHEAATEVVTVIPPVAVSASAARGAERAEPRTSAPRAAFTRRL
jgi:hypothetical protein